MFDLPMTRLKPFYPGQIGIRGSDDLRGVRTSAKGVVLYVDSSHGAANDDNRGTDPEAPLATLQEAVDKLSAAAVAGVAGRPYDPDYA